MIEYQYITEDIKLKLFKALMKRFDYPLMLHKEIFYMYITEWLLTKGYGKLSSSNYLETLSDEFLDWVRIRNNLMGI